ncbi:uncharacterized protein LOC128259926 [Drosophila gunungcola]|uniref:Uncharacterized protein n=1 Tax=Drosophila gunungcola TaxID=103775 RepID=A0A9P9YJK7_9MUSC|nr:uncharacterized protein LOC128259926 [Drosophila gunungcola]KAI8037778.1 hypothetical protein M5D96_009279 [Drosophila gunungcola]
MELSPIPDHWLNGLRSVPATTNLRPRTRRRWYSASRSVSPSPSPSSTSNSSLLRRPSILRRRTGNRAFSVAQAQAIFRAERLMTGSLTDVDDYSDVESAERCHRNVFARTLRRGNSISDCSQCSSDEEQDKVKCKNKKPTVPSHLAEWLYPV